MEKDRLIAIAHDSVRWTKWFFISSLFVAILIAMANARADDVHLIVNGKAIHFNEKPGVHYNESNWGLGFQYDMADKKDEVIPFIAASGFIDSNRNASYYAGGGVMRRYHFHAGDTKMHADLGGIVFAMTRKGFKNGDPFLGALPAFSVGTDKVAVNMTFIPQVDPKAVPLFFFQLKINLDLFKSGR